MRRLRPVDFYGNICLTLWIGVWVAIAVTIAVTMI
jgi:hypothetical protein